MTRQCGQEKTAGEFHQAAAVKRLEAANTTREIAEFERKIPASETAATISATSAELCSESSSEQLDDKSKRVNY